MIPNLFKKKNNWIGGGWVWSDQSKFLSDFLDFFNLTRPLRANVCQQVQSPLGIVLISKILVFI